MTVYVMECGEDPAPQGWRLQVGDRGVTPLSGTPGAWVVRDVANASARSRIAETCRILCNTTRADRSSILMPGQLQRSWARYSPAKYQQSKGQQ